MIGKKTAPKVSTHIDTWLGKDTSIDGTIKAQGTLRLDGTFTGDVISEGDVILGPEALVTGNIEAGNVLLAGRLKGDVMSTGRVEMAASGRLEGNINARALVVNEGAVILGHCRSGQITDKPNQAEVIKLREENLA